MKKLFSFIIITMFCAVVGVNMYLANNTASLVDNSLMLDDVEMVASAQELSEPGGGGGSGNPNNPTIWKCMYCDNMRYYSHSGTALYCSSPTGCDYIEVADYHFQCVFSNYSTGGDGCVYGSRKTESGSSWYWNCSYGGVSLGLDGYHY